MTEENTAGEGGGLVSVNYGWFDKLSDDGAAVLIAEAIAAKSRPPLQSQDSALMRSDMQRLDEAAGRYVSRAGFDSSGFAEWLEARKHLAAGVPGNTVSDGERMAAFMRGYLSQRSIESKQANSNSTRP